MKTDFQDIDLSYTPETVFFSEILKNDDRYKGDWKKIDTILRKYRIKQGFLSGTKDIWSRDYMPVKVTDSKYVQFQYYSKYIRPKKYDHLRTIPSDISEIEQFQPINATDIILDGGNIVRRKDKIFISNRIYSDNPDTSKNKLIEKVERLLEGEVIIIPGMGDMTGHSDGMVRFLDDTTIMVNDREKLQQLSPNWVNGFNRAIKGRNLLDVVDVTFFDDPDKMRKESAIGCYLNYLEIGNLIILPVFASSEITEVGNQKIADIDQDVIQQFEQLFPNYGIEPVEINNIAFRGGLMNCISWETKTPIPAYKDLTIIPVYSQGDEILVILAKDFAEGVMIDDGWCSKISLKSMEFTPALRGQNFFRFSPVWEPITTQERPGWIRKISNQISDAVIRDIEAILKKQQIEQPRG